MCNPWISVVLTLAFLGVAAIGSHSAESQPPKAQEQEEEQEEVVSLEEVPAAVRESILSHAGDHEILEVERFVVDGAHYYEAEWIEGEMEVEIVLDSDGSLVETETEPVENEAEGKPDEEDESVAEDDDE